MVLLPKHSLTYRRREIAVEEIDKIGGPHQRPGYWWDVGLYRSAQRHPSRRFFRVKIVQAVDPSLCGRLNIRNPPKPISAPIVTVRECTLRQLLVEFVAHFVNFNEISRGLRLAIKGRSL